MIRVNNLWKNFRKHDALRGLTFSVAEGSAFALIGANGAGKTTTIKVLTNIIEPSRGEAQVIAASTRRRLEASSSDSPASRPWIHRASAGVYFVSQIWRFY